MYDFLNGNEKYVASDKLRKTVRRNIMKNKIAYTAKTVGGTLAVLVVAFSLSVNVSPSLAMAMSDVPVLGSVVRVVTFNRYENKIGGSEAEIVTPKIEGLENEELMNEINDALGENAHKLIAEFEKEALLLKEEYGDNAHMGVGSDYIVRTDTDEYYALDVFYYNTVGSSSTVHKFYTIDKKTGELVSLDGLFKENSDYVSVISEIVKDEMRRRNKEEEGLFWIEDDEFTDSFEEIKENQNFFINEEGNIVICFDKYEVAAGAQGTPEFEIEKELIKEILK